MSTADAVTNRTPEHVRCCPTCGTPLTGRQRGACASERCRRSVHRARPPTISPEDRAALDKVLADASAELDQLLGPPRTREQLRALVGVARAPEPEVDLTCPRPDYARRAGGARG